NASHGIIDNFIDFGVHILHRIDGNRGVHPIRTNNRLFGFDDMTTGCGGGVVSSREYATHWRWIAQCHGVIRGGIAFHHIRWTGHVSYTHLMLPTIFRVSDGCVANSIRTVSTLPKPVSVVIDYC
ncbi:hypothetical protein, partial [Vibrio sp. S512-13]|uniref:hypothetical protein n=1 Tax=Vibrio sp. S512-13 TaxID=1620394 RepID=UPI000AFEF24B